ncbi:MAG: SDR family oxidoreductase [bacterium]|nr:SDR family oxidoreductase [bacterium]
MTGSARGLGRHIALGLGQDGHEVVVHYRASRRDAESVVSLIRGAGGRAHSVRGDVTVPREVQAMAERILADVGGLDAVVNNVGQFVVKSLDDLTVEEWDAQIASTVSATFYVSRAMLPMLRERGGRIINISDSGADRISARPRTLPYYVGKTGILMLTKTMAVTEAQYGITVNAILPGVLENSEPLLPLTRIPAGRYGRFDDVAAAVRFLIAETSDYISGSFIQVGGGWNL